MGFLFVSVLSGLFRGDNISINPGTIFKAYVDKDTIIFNDAPELAEEIIVSGESDIDARLLKMYRDLEKK